MQDEAQILFTEITAAKGKMGIITLNRPRALNALSSTMIMALSQRLQQWASDTTINLVLIKSNSAQAFCAGGDLKEVYQYGTTANHDGLHFYAEEYKLNLFIYNYPKPYIALVDGIAMGGGLGISLHGQRIIVGEHLQLAMPETGIGFFPDVGAGFFFQRCPHKIGMYLGLTGNIIGAADALYARLVHAYVPSKNHAALLSTLQQQDLTVDPLAKFDAIVANLRQEPGRNSLAEYAPTIEDCFSADSVEAILAALNKTNSTWAKQQIEVLHTKSPTSLKVTFKLLNLTAKLPLAACLDLEFKLARNIFQQHDIYEGIRALLLDKTRDPKWQPASLDAVSDTDIDKLFNNLK